MVKTAAPAIGDNTGERWSRQLNVTATNHCGNSSIGKLFMLAGTAIPTPPAGAANTDIVDAESREGDKVSFNIASDFRTGKSRAATVTVIQ